MYMRFWNSKWIASYYVTNIDGIHPWREREVNFIFRMVWIYFEFFENQVDWHKKEVNSPITLHGNTEIQSYIADVFLIETHT